MRTICKAFFILLLLSTTCTAQVATIMMKPANYEQPDGDIEEGKSKSSRNLWLAFSDRDNNNAYQSPSEGSAVLSTVNYMDKFYVTGESGNFLELYKWKDDPDLKIKGSKGATQLNPNKAERVGWVNKQNLLLWSKCLINKQTGFAEKAMAVFSAKNIDKDVNNGSVRIYGSPNGDKENGNTVKMFSFLYVYKRSGSRVLIGKVSRTQVYAADRDILGWIDDVFLQLWPDRVCLEPNHDPEAVKARKAANVKASLFYSKEEAIAWKEGRLNQPTWDKDSYEQPLKPSDPRFPIFGQETIDGNLLVNTGFQTEIFSEGSTSFTDKKVTGQRVMSSAELANARLEYQKVLAKSRQFNIVFVIDAGYGMNNYADAIKTSIQNLVRRKEEMNNEGEKHNNYRYGAVVYRSEEDNVCPGGNLSLIKMPLTSNARDVLGFINKQFQDEGCSNNRLNKNTNNALLQAFKMIKDVHKDKYIQSNCVFFIGGATGNKAPDLKDLPELIAQYDISLSVFQVQCMADPEEYERFPDIFQRILKEATERKKALTETRYRENIVFKNTIGRQNLFSLDFPKTSPVQGNVNFPDKGDLIPAQVMDNIIDKTITDYEKNIEDAIADYKTLLEGTGEKNVGTLNAVVKNYLNRLGGALANFDLVNKFNGRNVQFFIPGWTTPNVNSLNSDEPVYKYVLYLTEEELTDLNDKLYELTAGEAPPSEQRNKLYDTYASLAQAYFGKEIADDAKFESKITIDQIIKKITGLPTKSQLMKNTGFMDIKDPAKVSDSKIEQIIMNIRKSYEALRVAKNDVQSQFRYPTDDGTFYWIPQEYLP